MKSYLSLIPISAKVRKRQNRMTVLCIIISVFLVTAIFSVADMMIRTESDFMISNHGNWHIAIKNISQNNADEISNRSDVTAVGVASQFNFEGEQPYRVNEKRTVLYGTDEVYITQISNGIVEGTFPANDEEVMLTPNSVTALGVQLGDSVTLHTPAGDRTFTISGFGTDDESYYNNQTYLIGSYLTQSAFTSVMAQNGVTNNELTYYVQFESAAKAANAITELQTQYQLSDGSISENTGVMGMAGQSNNTAMQSMYGLAAILFVLVLLAGILMISGSMNSIIAQRTQFFGMLRCIGASRQQIIRFVRLEALNWCKTAVPIGVVFGTIISWIICATLHYGIGGEFSTTPVFQISPVGLISGVEEVMETIRAAERAEAASVVITFFYTIANSILSTNDMFLTQPFGLNIGTLFPGPLAFRWTFQFYDQSQTSAELADLLERVSPYFLNGVQVFGVIIVEAIVFLALIAFVYRRQEI